jgi:16S rRNA (uracil1498-N3)-methyltransferase
MATSLMMARRRFFVEAVHRGVASLVGDEAAHLTRVLRVEKGQQFEISDNSQVWLAEVTEARKSLVEFQVIEPLESGPQPAPVHLYAALFKFDRFEWMVEKVTELGVARIIPVESARSDEGLFLAAHKRAERWRKIAREASQQARRTTMPEIAEPIKLRAVQAESPRILLDEMPGTPPLSIPDEWTVERPLSLLLGPAGGWTDDERAMMTQKGWAARSLGPTVLRAETASIAAVSIVTHALYAQTKTPLK